ncbi:MAG: PHP domain-containing protein [Proteobacteria bacterium]|nr:PHP domain-containing protein [Pseudomonadota bacterium]
MILDLHNHSIKSDDGRAKVENYCQWIRKRGLPIDGFVLTEHRQFDAESDYRGLEDRTGLLILKGSEVETDYGHVLVFGVNSDMLAAFDFGRVDLSLERVLREVSRCGGVAVPCHPGRPRVGMCAHVEQRGAVEGVEIVETLNGGSRGRENQVAASLAERMGYRGVGGSDAHIVSHIGRCATRFEREIASIEDLVGALRAGGYEAVQWE